MIFSIPIAIADYSIDSEPELSDMLNMIVAEVCIYVCNSCHMAYREIRLLSPQVW